MFTPRVALASLSGASTAAWASRMDDIVGAAFLGGLAVDEPTRAAARDLVARGRAEFLPADPFAFLEAQLLAVADASLTPGYNVRAVEPTAIERAATVCEAHGAILEINAHCRQAEMCARGAGEALLRDRERLLAHIEAAGSTGAVVSVKVRAEVDGVDLPALAAAASAAGAGILHVDAMDSEPVVGRIRPRFDGLLIANNGVRDERTVREYVEYGADAVSVGRPSDDPVVLQRVADAMARCRRRVEANR